MILALVVGLVIQSEPSRWIEINRNDRETVHLDAASMRVLGDRRVVWSRTTYAAPRPNGALTELYNFEINCAQRTSELISFTSRNRAGALIETQMMQQRRMSPIVPESVGEIIFTVACPQPSRNSN